MSSDENGNGGPAAARQRLEEKVERVRTSVQELASRESIHDLRETLDLEELTRRHPYGMVAAALGVGFVLGGGLSSSLTRGLVRAGLRLGLKASALPFLEKELVALLTREDGPREPGTKGDVP